MYLSWLPLNSRSSDVSDDLADVQKMHQRTLTGFSDILGLGVGREAHGVLWRVDTNNAGSVLIVQSATLPNWSRLPGDYCHTAPGVQDVTPLQKVLRAGGTFRFRLDGNATRSERGRNGTRLPLKLTHDQLDWLRNEATKGGFQLVGATDVATPPKRTGLRVKNGRTNAITVQAARYDGILTVTDPAAFWNTLSTGIGPAKAYGCGMLSLGKRTNASR